MSRKILVVDDTRNVQLLINDFLTGQDFQVLLASDGEEALEIVRNNTIDLILLDIMMPNMDGYQFISHLRKESNLPVIMITAKQQEADIIRGFDLGADDYITKPFKLRELLVRMRAVMRRAPRQAEQSSLISVGNLIMDPDKHEVWLKEEKIELTPLEFQILAELLKSVGKVVKRTDLAIHLMENGYTGSEATLKIHIRNIRMKLGDNLDMPKYIETVFGIGYRFLEEVE